MSAAANVLAVIIQRTFDKEIQRKSAKALIVNIQQPLPKELRGTQVFQILMYAPSIHVGVYTRTYSETIPAEGLEWVEGTEPEGLVNMGQSDGFWRTKKGFKYKYDNGTWEQKSSSISHSMALKQIFSTLPFGMLDPKEREWYKIVNVDENMAKDLWEARNGGSIVGVEVSEEDCPCFCYCCANDLGHCGNSKCGVGDDRPESPGIETGVLKESPPSTDGKDVVATEDEPKAHDDDWCPECGSVAGVNCSLKDGV